MKFAIRRPPFFPPFPSFFSSFPPAFPPPFFFVLCFLLPGESFISPRRSLRSKTSASRACEWLVINSKRATGFLSCEFFNSRLTQFPWGRISMQVATNEWWQGWRTLDYPFVLFIAGMKFSAPRDKVPLCKFPFSIVSIILFIVPILHRSVSRHGSHVPRKRGRRRDD